MRSFLFLTIICLLCFGCKNDASKTIQKQPIATKLDSLSKEKINQKLLELSPDAKKDLESFEDFQNLKKLVLSLNQSNAFYVQKHADSLGTLIQIVDDNLSENLNTNSINSRLALLATECGLLKEITKKTAPKSDKIMNANTQLMKAYNSLVIQLNELYLAIPENIEKELLRKKDAARDPITK